MCGLFVRAWTNDVRFAQSIIRSSNLRNVAQSTRHATSAKGKEEMTDTDGKKFLDSMHDQFIEKLHGAFLELYGIEITNIRVEDFRVSSFVIEWSSDV